MYKKVAYFRDGVLFNVIPRNFSVSLYDDRQVAYDADTVIISDKDVYDPLIPESINKLRIPSFNSNEQSVTLNLAYILKMRCNMMENPKYIPSFVNKTLEIMEASRVGWRRLDYLRVICNYYCNGLFEAGDCFEAQYRASHKELFSDSTDEFQEAEHLSAKYYFEAKWHRHSEFYAIKQLFPNLVPDTPKGYLQIRTRRTKRFLAIEAAVKEKGFTFNYDPPFHFCRKKNEKVTMSTEYDHSGHYPQVVSCRCSLYDKGRCNGKDEYGLSCVYPTKVIPES